eukprot:5698957-Alexandrium_andersonii.AAC.1
MRPGSCRGQLWAAPTRGGEGGGCSRGSNCSRCRAVAAAAHDEGDGRAAGAAGAQLLPDARRRSSAAPRASSQA